MFPSGVVSSVTNGLNVNVFLSVRLVLFSFGRMTTQIIAKTIL